MQQFGSFFTKEWLKKQKPFEDSKPMGLKVDIAKKLHFSGCSSLAHSSPEND